MSGDTLFTVIIPLYNKAAHIARALESVFAQTYQDYELIVVNDASTDGSARIAASLLGNRARCRLLNRDLPGKGGYAARNLGSSTAASPWLAFLDADDEWTPDHLNDLKELIDSGIDSKFLCTGVIEILPDGNPWENRYLRSRDTGATGVITLLEYARMASRGKNPLFTSAVAVNRDFYLEKGGFPERDFARGGDRETWIRFLSSTSLGWIGRESALYHRDAENMVTKTTAFEIDLCMDSTVRTLVSQSRSSGDSVLARELMKMLNFERMRPIRRKLESGTLRPSDFRKLYFTANPVYSLCILLISLLPRSLVKLLLSMKRKHLK